MLLFTLITILVLALLYGAFCLFFWLFQERFIFIRFRVASNYVFKFAQPFDEIFLDTPDGAHLHGLHFRTPEPRGVVLYYHGNTGSLRRWGKRASRFLKLGHDVVMMDYRGYGKSQGPVNDAALHADAARWYSWVKERYREEVIVVYGRSLGSGFAVPVAAAHAPRMLVLESPFANFADAAWHYLALLPYNWLLRYPFRNDKAIKRVKCPVYIFHGRRDPVVPYASALRLYSLIASDTRREMITFNKGYHSDLGTYRRFHRKMRLLLVGKAPGSPAKTAPIR